MDRLFLSVRALRGSRRSAAALGFAWCAGLLSGMFFVAQLDGAVLSWMRTAAGGRVSIVGLLLGNLLPFFLCCIAFSFSIPRLAYAVCFLRSALYGFCALGVGLAFGRAGWLVQILLLFSDILTMPALLWFCLRHIHGEFRSRGRDFTLCAGYTAAVSAMELLWVAPFLAQLLSL